MGVARQKRALRRVRGRRRRAKRHRLMAAVVRRRSKPVSVASALRQKRIRAVGTPHSVRQGVGTVGFLDGARARVREPKPYGRVARVRGTRIARQKELRAPPPASLTPLRAGGRPWRAASLGYA